MFERSLGLGLEASRGHFLWSCSWSWDLWFWSWSWKKVSFTSLAYTKVHADNLHRTFIRLCCAIYMELSTRYTQALCPITDFFSKAAENFPAYWTLAHQARWTASDDSMLYQLSLYLLTYLPARFIHNSMAWWRSDQHNRREAWAHYVKYLGCNNNSYLPHTE